MRLGEAKVTLQTQLRNEHGRFLLAAEEGAARAAEELANHIADEATANILANLKERSGTLVGSVEARMIGAHQGQVTVTAPWAADQEFGTTPHNIPNAFGWGPDFGIGGRFGGFFHPGNPAVHFLKRAGEGTALIGLGIAARYMPK